MDDSKECYICLSNFETVSWQHRLVRVSEGSMQDELIRKLPCQHEFHAHCIDKWLLDVHRTCPCCRVDICEVTRPLFERVKGLTCTCRR